MVSALCCWNGLDNMLDLMHTTHLNEKKQNKELRSNNWLYTVKI